VRLRSMALSAVGFCLLVFVQVTTARSSDDACGLPNDLQSIVEGKYPGAKVVTLSDLNEDDRELFQKDHGDACPGLAKVDFYGDGKPTLALALTTKGKARRSTKLVLAHNSGTAWETTTLDTADGPAPVVWSEGPGEYIGVYQHKIRAKTPVIVFCGYSSWAVLYAWTNNRVAKIWLSD